MKPVHRMPVLLLATVDACAVLAAVYLTCWLRVALNPVFSRAFTIEGTLLFFPSRIVVVGMWLWALSTAGAYDIRPGIGSRISLPTLARCALIASIGAVVLMFLLRTSQEDLSRSLILLWAPVTIVLVAIGRNLAVRVLRHLADSGYAVERVAIVGEGLQAAAVGRRIHDFVGHVVQVVGFVTPDGHGAIEPFLGSVASIKDVVNRHRIDRVILADSTLSRAAVSRVALLCEQMGVRLDMVADFLGLASKRVSMWEIEGLPLISVERREFTRADEVVKRASDIVTSFVLTALLSPLLALVALLIKLDSPGPVLYWEDRVGKGGRHFRMYKFRSMYTDADARRADLAAANEKDGHLFKVRNDPRITRVGRWIRRFSIDELPQVFNILKGEMSLVGPRPLPVLDLEGRDSDFATWIEQRQKMLPGVTGVWQVRGRSELPFEDMVKFDLYYLENWSLWLDAQILVRTLPAVFSGGGAY